MKFWIVDAFADAAFKGNPAAVILIEDFPRDDLMQAIASEFNLSETVFCKLLDTNLYHLRWFTPNSEAPLCGHATIAASYVISQIETLVESSKIYFETLSGKVCAEINREWVTLDFPRYVPEQIELTTSLKEVVNSIPIYTGFSKNCYLMEFQTTDQILDLQPNLDLLQKLPCRALIVTSKGRDEKFPEYDFISRYFAPKVGINEDPVCASSHCRLIPYWAAKLAQKSLIAYQASKRGGIISCEELESRVLISGMATIIGEGIIYDKHLS